MVHLYCKCCQHMAGNTNASANFYDANFIPDTWKSHYSRLSECAGIILAGHCKDCYGNLEELIPIPKGLSGDALFQAIYDTMQTAHPYAKTSEHIDYYGACDERNEFYRRRDKFQTEGRRRLSCNDELSHHAPTVLWTPLTHRAGLE